MAPSERHLLPHQPVQTPMPRLLRVAAWKEYPWLRHGFSTRQDGLSRVYLDAADADGPGELNLGYTAEDDPEAVAANRLALAMAVWAQEAIWSQEDAVPPLVLLRQVHGVDVHTARAEDISRLMADGRAVTDGDGLVTAEAGLLIGVQAADCVPVLIADTRLRIVAALHAGWRGTVGGIAGAGVAQMRALGSDAGDLIAAVGPSIGPCCYAVGDEVRERFAERFAVAESLFAQRDGATYLNLWESNRRQLVAAGVPEQQVTTLAACSACTVSSGRRSFFSHRADRGHSGRMMAVIGIDART